MTAGVTFQLSSERNVGSREEAMFLSLSHYLPTGREIFSPKGQRAGFWSWDILIISFLTSASALLLRFSNPRGARAFGAIVSHGDKGADPKTEHPSSCPIQVSPTRWSKTPGRVRRCGVISYALSRQPYFTSCALPEALRRHSLRAVAAAVFSSLSLRRLRHKLAEHRIPDVSATPDVEASRITSCRGSRVSLTFVHVVAVALLPTAASRVRTSLIFPCSCCRNPGIRLRVPHRQAGGSSQLRRKKVPKLNSCVASLVWCVFLGCPHDHAPFGLG